MRVSPHIRLALFAAVLLLSSVSADLGKEITPENVCEMTHKQGKQTIGLQMACLNQGAYDDTTGFALGWTEVAALDSTMSRFGKKVVVKRKAYIAEKVSTHQCAIVFQGSQHPNDFVNDVDGAGIYVDVYPDLYNDQPLKPYKKRQLRGETAEEETLDVEQLLETLQQEQGGSYGVPPNPRDPGHRIYGMFPGFFRAMLSFNSDKNWPLWRDMYRSVRDTKNGRCRGGVFITGHSLGGAVASVHKLFHFGEDSDDATLFIFGSPKPIKEGFNDCSGTRYYITSTEKSGKKGDPIAGLKPGWIHGHRGVNLQIGDGTEGGLTFQAMDRGCPQTKKTMDEQSYTVDVDRHKIYMYAYSIYKTEMNNKLGGVVGGDVIVM